MSTNFLNSLDEISERYADLADRTVGANLNLRSDEDRRELELRLLSIGAPPDFARVVAKYRFEQFFIGSFSVWTNAIKDLFTNINEEQEILDRSRFFFCGRYDSESILFLTEANGYYVTDSDEDRVVGPLGFEFSDIVIHLANLSIIKSQDQESFLGNSARYIERISAGDATISPASWEYVASF